MIDLIGISNEGEQMVATQYNPTTEQGQERREQFERICKNAGLICINLTELLKFAVKIMKTEGDSNNE